MFSELNFPHHIAHNHNQLVWTLAQETASINGFHTASCTPTTSSSGHLRRKLPVKYDNNDRPEYRNISSPGNETPRESTLVKVEWKTEARSSSAARQHAPFQANGCFLYQRFPHRIAHTHNQLVWTLAQETASEIRQ
ncbi:hypothetical protein J3Q64DRAFT_1827037 [Phycomyces blakesleeanus]|uniref:Uncharacterized protein n=1 Tax=Phycomyces blakesleeanus TaxID=4837 RepID=A0ABR3BB17_PHYBL